MSNTYHATDTLGIKFTSVSTSQQGFELGQKKRDQLGNLWQYVQANGAITIYDAVKIDDDFQIVPITSTISGDEPTKVGVAQNAFADNEYGWVMIQGKGSVNAIALTAHDVKIYTCATAGFVDDASADEIFGLKLIATVGGSNAAAAFFAATEMYTN